MRYELEQRKADLQLRQVHLEVAQRGNFFSGFRNAAIDAELAANSAKIADLSKKLRQLV
jgi:hypothetical protein